MGCAGDAMQTVWHPHLAAARPAHGPGHEILPAPQPGKYPSARYAEKMLQAAWNNTAAPMPVVLARSQPNTSDGKKTLSRAGSSVVAKWPSAKTALLRNNPTPTLAPSTVTRHL